MQLEIEWTLDPAERQVLTILRTHRGLAAAIPMPRLASPTKPIVAAMMTACHGTCHM